MKRRAFNVLAAVSLAMAIAVAGLWARSMWLATDEVSVDVGKRRWRVASIAGQILVAEFPAYWEDGTNEGNGPRKGVPGMFLPTEPSSARWEPWHWETYNDWAYLVLCMDSDSPIETSTAFTTADWLLILVFAAPPTASFVMRLRHRKAVGLCPKCNYDLRGTPGPACPECGAAIPSKVG